MCRLIRFLVVCLLSAAVTMPACCAERGVLFRLSLGTHVMHLFGTLHVGLPEFYPLDPRLMAALAGSTTLALEMDPEPPREALLRAMSTYGTLAAGEPSYDTVLDADARQRLGTLVRTSGLEAASVPTIKPVVLAALLAVAEYAKLGYRIDLSSDAYLAHQARSAGIRVLGLETLDSQLALLDRLAPPDRWRYLDETVTAIASGAQRTAARAMVLAWSTADRVSLDAIAARCAADASVAGRFVEAVLIRERNEGLADKLLALLAAEERTVAGIGVLHLLGEGSVLELLAANGVSVEKIY